MLRERFFVTPPAATFAAAQEDGAVYAQYNYLRPGLIPRLKRHRFEVALEMAVAHGIRGGVIDVGCADGVLVPSLARHFTHVAAVDVNEHLLRGAESLARALSLDNVRVLSNRGISFAGLRERLAPQRFQAAFLLETLEHVGQREAMYEGKMAFLADVFSLLEADGVVIVSVPKMVGLSFLLKYAVQAGLRMERERHGWGDLFRAGVLRDTDALEPRWNRGHIGFNHLKLERHLRRDFRIVRRRDLGFSMVYLVARGAAASGSIDP